MSGGHLCEAEAPTEPAGETQNGCGNPFFSLGYYGFFRASAQNDKQFSYSEYLWHAVMLSFTCHCEGAGVRRTPLQSRSTDRAGRRDRRKVRGNPFSSF